MHRIIKTLQSNQAFQKYSGIVQIYIPLVSKFSIAIRSAGGTVTGNPLFYQLPHIGGADDLQMDIGVKDFLVKQLSQIVTS